MASIIILYFLSFTTAQAQFVPFAFWTSEQDPCGGVAIGASCTGGALYAGVFLGKKYMVVPGNCNVSTTPAVCNGATDSVDVRWDPSTPYHDVVGVENVALTASPSTVLGDVGTAAMVADPLIGAGSAAHFCDSMVYGGYDDWYLPSKSELVHIYCHADVNPPNSGNPAENVGCASYGGHRRLIPGFDPSNHYHSSTERDADNFHNIYFATGTQYAVTKSYLKSARCVRRYGG